MTDELLWNQFTHTNTGSTHRMDTTAQCGGLGSGLWSLTARVQLLVMSLGSFEPMDLTSPRRSVFLSGKQQ